MTWSTHAQLLNPATRDGRAPIIRRASDGCTSHRWTLTRHCVDDARPERLLPWLMLNPSEADDKQEDPTLLRILQWTWRWGFDGPLLLNIYPFRTPHPRVLAQRVVGWAERQDWGVRDDIWANHHIVKAKLAPFDAVMAAWGTPAGSLGHETDLWVENLLEEIGTSRDVEDQLTLWCIGRTKAGDPTHPMARGRSRVPDDVRPQVWRGGI
jgi:hypothetical protein